MPAEARWQMPSLPIGKLERELALTRLVLQWSQAIGHGRSSARTPAQAVRQAKELARLMDMVEMEDVGLDGLAALVPDDFSAHWGLTLDFLKIVTEHWPRHLDELGKVSPAGWRKRLMLTEAERLQRSPPPQPTIVAGVTGTVPAATALMRAVLALKQGALILPALDQTLDDESWNAISPAHAEHPQFGLKKLLDALGVARKDVTLLPGTTPAPRQQACAAFVSEAMRPAGTTERWHSFLAASKPRDLAAALAGWTILEAPSAADEAEAVALILREAAEHPGKTAMLVTPDRALARRVSVRLKAWALEVPDLSGRPLAGTEIGIFLDLLIAAAAERFQPVALLRLLKHPLCRAGLDAPSRADGTRALELAVFRAPYLGGSLADIVAALERAAKGTLPGAHRGRAVRQIAADAWQAARQLLASLEAILRPLEALFAAPGRTAVPTLATAHVRAAQALAAGLGEESQDAPGRAMGAKSLPDCLPAFSTPAWSMRPSWRRPTIRSSTAVSSAIRPSLRRGRGIRGSPSWGPSRPACNSPISSSSGRSTRAAGHRRPTQGRGSTAACAKRSVCRRRKRASARRRTLRLAARRRAGLSHARCQDRRRADGAIALAASACRPSAGRRAGRQRQATLARLGRTRKTAARRRPTGAAPEPRPAPRLRPRQLSVTAIEKWLANPYAIFAARILGLERCRLNAHARCGAARPNRARGLEPVRPPLSRATARRSRDPSQGRGGGRPGRPHGLAPRRRLLGAAAGTLRRLVRRDRAGAPTRRRQELCRARRGARAGRRPVGPLR